MIWEFPSSYFLTQATPICLLQLGPTGVNTNPLLDTTEGKAVWKTKITEAPQIFFVLCVRVLWTLEQYYQQTAQTPPPQPIPEHTSRSL